MKNMFVLVISLQNGINETDFIQVKQTADKQTVYAECFKINAAHLSDKFPSYFIELFGCIKFFI